MASATTAAPKKGRKTNAELQKENSALERQLQEKQAVSGLWKFGIAIILVLGVVFGGIWFLVNLNSDHTAEPNVTSASQEVRGTGYVSGSWGEVSKHLQDTDVQSRWDAMDAAMAQHRGFEIPDEAIRDHLVREVELADPDRYVWTANRALTGWLNTNWDGVSPKILADSFQVGDKFLVMEIDILAKYGVDVSKIQTEALVTIPDGTVCVILTRAICTNHIWPVGAPMVTEKQRPEDEPQDEPEEVVRERKPLKYTSPLATPHQSENPYTQDDPSYDVEEPTGGYVPGNVEEVEEDRGTGEDTTGAPGTGTEGGTTPGGSTTIGDTIIVDDGEPPAGDPVDGSSGTEVEEPVPGLDPEDLGND